ncbi:hypothetical protein [Halococcus thailandensis]|uniref:Uncharacterized protein n=1 Tax=Halococcus thailandensis JCM 13552 TaxID=1227457 RepID=M0NAK1_9EURY|nr:hypothetical protein [Halococcus thailandensis]EMA54588.1 hypothetical protein C451_06305 [Halococcus thailandensis JCM 13552]
MDRGRRLLGTVGLIGALVLAATGPGGAVPGGEFSQLNTSTPMAQSSGAQFAGGIGIEGTTLDNELQRRALNASLRRAQTPAATLDVVDQEMIALDSRLDSLEARSARLATDQRTGRIEHDHYRAALANIKTATTGVSQRIAILRNTVRGLPTAANDSTGSLSSELDRLATRTHSIAESNDTENVGDDDRTGDDDDQTDDDDRTDDDDITDDDDRTDDDDGGDDDG